MLSDKEGSDGDNLLSEQKRFLLSSESVQTCFMDSYGFLWKTRLDVVRFTLQVVWSRLLGELNKAWWRREVHLIRCCSFMCFRIRKVPIAHHISIIDLQSTVCPVIQCLETTSVH